MERMMLKGKIHRATVTDANLDYEGSITVDQKLMEAADIIQFEQVHIYNISNGNRFETYCIEGPPGSGTICLNGAAARMVSRGDLVIIAAYGLMNAEEIKSHKPKLVYVDAQNRIVKVANKRVA
ncbi:MAG: aspartate 1-decarboxylase [Proteobacteria bacterium]|nr:aspartate 1-decarboxylase [Pseudomonadota bacterium]